MKIGTMRELNLRPGDVVEWVDLETIHTVNSINIVAHGQFSDEFQVHLSNYGTGIFVDERFCIVSRANDTPKLWRDMTDEEKGALLLADHEGKVIHSFTGGEWMLCDPQWRDDFAYRVKPEPVRVVVNAFIDCLGRVTSVRAFDDTHRITFDTIDGEPDCDSIKMEKL